MFWCGLRGRCVRIIPGTPPLVGSGWGVAGGAGETAGGTAGGRDLVGSFFIGSGNVNRVAM